MTRALKNGIADIGHGVDPRRLAGSHPWLSLLVAAVAGFVASAAVVPSEEDQLLKKLSKIENRWTAPRAAPLPARSVSPDHDRDGKKDKKHTSFMGLVTAELIKLARPMVTTLLSAYLAKPQGEDSQTEQPEQTAASTSDAA